MELISVHLNYPLTQLDIYTIQFTRLFHFGSTFEPTNKNLVICYIDIMIVPQNESETSKWLSNLCAQTCLV